MFKDVYICSVYAHVYMYAFVCAAGVHPEWKPM